MVTLSGGYRSCVCYYCLLADKRLKTCKDETFSKTGFCNWKKALSKFDKHEQTMSHRVAIDVVVTIQSTTKNVGEMLSSSLADQRSRNKKNSLSNSQQYSISSVFVSSKKRLFLRSDKGYQINFGNACNKCHQ